MVVFLVFEGGRGFWGRNLPQLELYHFPYILVVRFWLLDFGCYIYNLLVVVLTRILFIFTSLLVFVADRDFILSSQFPFLRLFLNRFIRVLYNLVLFAFYIFFISIFYVYFYVLFLFSIFIYTQLLFILFILTK